MEQRVLHRYHIELNSDYPIIEKVLPAFETKWDVYKNDKMKSRNRVDLCIYSSCITCIINADHPIRHIAGHQDHPPKTDDEEIG